MPRVKGSKNKVTSKVKLDIYGNEKSNSKVMAEEIKVKKVIDNKSVAKTIINKENKSKGSSKGRPKGGSYSHVLWLTDSLYITCDTRTFMIKKVNKAINKVTKEKYPDLPFLYAPNLDDMLRIAANYMIHVPANYEELIERMEKIYSLIDARVPAGISPKDIFDDFNPDEEE